MLTSTPDPSRSRGEPQSLSTAHRGCASPCPNGPHANQYHHAIPRQVRSARLPASKALSYLLILFSVSCTFHLRTRPSPALNVMHSSRNPWREVLWEKPPKATTDKCTEHMLLGRGQGKERPSSDLGHGRGSYTRRVPSWGPESGHQNLNLTKDKVASVARAPREPTRGQWGFKFNQQGSRTRPGCRGRFRAWPVLGFAPGQAFKSVRTNLTASVITQTGLTMAWDQKFESYKKNPGGQDWSNCICKTEGDSSHFSGLGS